MVKKNMHGGALALVLLAISIILLLLVALNQVLISLLRSASNAIDYDLAASYAKSALLSAEAAVYNYDTNSGLEQPPISAGCPANPSSALRRFNCVLKQSGSNYNIVANGALCNNANPRLRGWCYRSAGGAAANNWANNLPNSLSDPGFQPWLSNDPSNNSLLPCASYTAAVSLPWIDATTANGQPSYAASYNSGDSTLCAQPRYMLEVINLNYIGRSVLALNEAQPGNELGTVTQTNGGVVTLYKNGAGAMPSGRLYRITVRAFGRNGNTRVSVQEYLAIEGYQGANKRTKGDSNGNQSYRIIPLSVRWL